MTLGSDLQGKTALITGASRGIGSAIARGLGQAGARVLLTSRKQESVEDAARELREDNLDAHGFVCHQGKPDAVRELFADLDAKDMCPNVVVINAATNPVFGPLMDLEPEAWRKILEVNLTGSLLTAQQAARRMIPRNEGSIIFISSIAGISPMPGLGAYGISKTGMLGMMRTLAQELGPKGVRVNAIAPGLVETQFSQALFDNSHIYQAFLKTVPLGRHGQPEDIVGAAVFLASGASAYVTGQVLAVDGGSLI